MKINAPYTLHDYLDRELAVYNGKAPDHIVKEKKEEYRKLYAKWYARHYRLRMKQVTVQFTLTEFAKITARAKVRGMRLSSFIKSELKERNPERRGGQIKQGLLELFDIIEECLHEREYHRLPECLIILQSLNCEAS